jgi:hypothetical protein
MGTTLIFFTSGLLSSVAQATNTSTNANRSNGSNVY